MLKLDFTGSFKVEEVLTRWIWHLREEVSPRTQRCVDMEEAEGYTVYKNWWQTLYLSVSVPLLKYVQNLILATMAPTLIQGQLSATQNVASCADFVFLWFF